MNKIIVKMEFKRSTKRMHIYTQINDGDTIPSLYVKQSGLPTNPPPPTITVTIDVDA